LEKEAATGTDLNKHTMNDILKLLLIEKDYLSGEYIAERLGISRTAVWKHIKQLRKKGFDIFSSPNKGYLLRSFPECLIIPEMVELYYKDNLPFKVIYLDQVDSTNNYAKEMALKGEKKNFLVITDNQTSGRGRFNRSWISQKGKDLTFSICLKLNKSIQDFYKFTILSGLAVYHTLRDFISEGQKEFLKIKWPNDIYFENKKICGILSEMITEEMIMNYIIIGIGINVNSRRLYENAISLCEIINKEIDRNYWLSIFLRYFAEFYSYYENGEFLKVYEEWKKNMGWIEKDIRFDNGKEIIEGVLEDVSENGGIIIRKGKAVNTYYSGDLLIR